MLPLFEQNRILKGCYCDDYKSGRCPYSLHFASTYEWRLSGRKTNSLHSRNVLSINLIGGIFKQIVEAGPECHTIFSLTLSSGKSIPYPTPPFTYYTLSLTRIYAQPLAYSTLSHERMVTSMRGSVPFDAKGWSSQHERTIPSA